MSTSPLRFDRSGKGTNLHLFNTASGNLRRRRRKESILEFSGVAGLAMYVWKRVGWVDRVMVIWGTYRHTFADRCKNHDSSRKTMPHLYHTLIIYSRIAAQRPVLTTPASDSSPMIPSPRIPSSQQPSAVEVAAQALIKAIRESGGGEESCEQLNHS